MGKNRKIWIISEYYYPIVTSTGYYITEIAESLAVSSNNIHVICTNARYNEKDKINVPRNEIRNGVHIHRVLTGSINKNNLLTRAFRLFLSSVRLFFKILFNVKKNDQILVVTNPAFIIVLMPIIKMLKGIKYKILVHDIFPENLSAIGKINQGSLIYSLVKKVFDISYAKAQTCIAIGRDMKCVLEKKLNGKSEIIIIPNWADTTDVFPLKKTDTELIKKTGLQNQFVFQFAGNLGMAQGLDNLIEAISQVRNNNIHFLFVGSGAYESLLRDYISQHNLTNVTMVGLLERKKQNDFLNACDVGIVTLNNEMYGLGVPSKSYNIMATGKPVLIIADENSEISLCVSEHNIGWQVAPDNSAKLAEMFEQIYFEMQSDRRNYLNNPRSIAIQYFSKEIVLEKYHKLFD
jgi:glycosyltransferase involved in cell wall biosynthesis